MTNGPSHQSVFQRIQSLAERSPRRAVPLARRLVAACAQGEPLARARALLALGRALLCWERTDEARAHLRGALAVFTAHGHAAEALECRLALLQADFAQYARPDLAGELAVLAEQCARAGEPLLQARALLLRAALLNLLGHPAQAEQVCAALEPALAGNSPVDHARLQLVQATAAIQRSQYARADALLCQAEAAFAALRQPIERARCWFQRGWAALRQEQLVPALAGYRRAQGAFARLGLPIRQAFCDKALGLVLTRTGANDDALRALLRALETFTTLGRTSEVGACQLNLGTVYFASALWEAAAACYSRAETLYVEAGVVGEQLIARRNRVMAYRAQGRLAEARALLVIVEEQARQISDEAELAEVWAELAGVLADSDALDAAQEHYERAQALFEQLGHRVDAAECWVELGWLAARRDAWPAAAEHFSDAAPVLVGSPYYHWRVAYGLARCAEGGEAGAAIAHYRSAHATVARLRQNLASEAASSGVYALAEQLHADSLRYAASQGGLTDLLRFSEAQRALTLQRKLAMQQPPIPPHWQTRLDQLQAHMRALLTTPAGAEAHEGELDRTLAAYGETLVQARYSVPPPQPLQQASEHPFDLGELRAALSHADDDWTVLTYAIDDDVLQIVTVTPDTLALDRCALDATLRRSLDAACGPAYRRYTYCDLPYRSGHAQRPWGHLELLAEALLPRAMRERLHPGHRLLIVPAGQLHLLPWAALRLGQMWLVEQAIIQLLPSLTIGQHLAALAPVAGTDALIVGCQHFEGRAAALPHVPEEIEGVAAAWPGTCVVLADGRATCEELLARAARGDLGGYALLHIASHAKLFAGRGPLAHIKLWDGDLHLNAVAALRLNGALAVLSACEGAAADVLAGEEVLSLSWALLAAGASGTIASLWQTHDRANAAFVHALYAGLRDSGDPALALAVAQRSHLRAAEGDDEGLSDPYFWACYVLTGGKRLW